MKNILRLFAESPFEPLHQHRLKVRECVAQLHPLFEANLAGDTDEQNRITELISTLEKEADRIKVEIRRILPKGIFLPVNREDLLRYLKIQDDIADAVEDITVLLKIKELSAPLALTEEILKYLDCVLKVCKLADEATDQLRPLLDAGFKGADITRLIELVDKTEIAEREADNAGLSIARILFMYEDEMRTTDIFLWFRIFDLIGDIADYSEKTSELLRNMVSR